MDDSCPLNCEDLAMAEYIDLYFKHLDGIIGAVTLIAYGLHLMWNWRLPEKIPLALGKAVSSSGIPNGVAFLICAFSPEHVPKMQGLFVAFLIGGLALFSITMMDIAKPKSQDGNPAL